MAAGSSHKVLLTCRHPTGAAPNAADTTSGKIWLFDRNDRPVSSDATVTGVAGASVTLGAGALVAEWTRVAVNTDHTANGVAVGAYVTPALTANVGTVTVPSDHYLVDGRDGTYFVAAVTYTPSGERPRAIRFEFQISAAVDYQTAGSTVTVGADEVVLVEVLSERTFGTGDVEALVRTLSTGANVTTGAGAPSSTPAEEGDIYVDTTNDLVWLASGSASSADWKQATGAGGGDLLAANNLNDVASAVTSRQNLGVELGVDVQAYSAALDAVSGTNTGDEVAASTTAAGVVELLTTAELDTGTDTTRAATAAAIENSARSVKLDGIETAATADQTGAEIKSAYEGEADTNAFTDADHTKLDAIEAGADVTDSVSVAAAGAVMDSDISEGEGFVRKTGAGAYEAIKSNLASATDPGATDDSAAGYAVGSRWINTTGDKEFVCLDATATAAVWTETTAGAGGGISNVVEDTTPQLGGPLDVNGQEITGAIDLHSTGDIITELGDAAGVNKLSVRDSGAVEVAAVDSDGNITTAGTVDGRDLATDGTKLDTIETSATADQTGAEIKAAYELEADTNAFTDAEQTKLAGIEAGADVTDTTNVTAAGALMDSEVDVDLKTLVLPANTTISAYGATLVDDADAATARTTLDVDQAGTDNSTAVTLAGTPDYITLSGQELTRGLIDLSTDVTGDLPESALDVSAGAAGEQLTVNEAATALEYGLASKYLAVRKGSAGTITKGTPVYIDGWNAGLGVVEVEEADQSIAAQMPAVGLAFESITNAANARVLMIGILDGIDTSAFSVADRLYVSTAGTLTATKPTSGALQSVCTVLRSHASLGVVVVQGAGRSNAAPHFTAADKYWYGGTSGELTEGTITAAGRAILDDADAAAQRTTLGADITSASDVDDLTNITASTQSGTTYTLALADAFSTVILSNAAQATVTIPTNASVAFATGTRVVLYAAGAGGVTLTTTSLTLVGSGTPNKTIAQDEGLWLEKTATDSWIILGGTSA